jgi:hypothetical protein
MTINGTTRIRRTLLLTAALAASAAGAAPTAHAHGSVGDDLTGRQEAAIRLATRTYRNVDAAVAAGYVPVGGCVEAPGLGGMGYHYLNPALAADDIIDPAQPEMLLYDRDERGRLVLVGAEWFMADGDQDLTTDGDRPSLFGHPFDGPMPGHEPGMPVHYDLHAWVWEHNPSGDLAAFNPRLSCS